MPSTLTRRPLPALVALLALLLLTALVWWRVLHRSTSDSGSSSCPKPTSTPSAAPAQSLPAPADVTVQVLNSTNRAGIAGKARTALMAAGFKSPAPAANDKPTVHVKGVAEIRYGPTEAKAAKLLSFYLPGASLVANSSKSATVVISLGAKYKGVTPTSTVRAELVKQHLSTQSPPPTPAGRANC